MSLCYADYQYAECCYAECRGDVNLLMAMKGVLEMIFQEKSQT
jgi:hypothetical protein